MQNNSHKIINHNTIFKYLELCKIKVVLLMLLSVIVGLLLDITSLTLKKALLSLLGIGLTAASGGVINHILDIEIDKIMSRTKNRPLAKDELPKMHVVFFAIILCCSGLTILWNFANALTVYLTASAMFGYAFVYTVFLKHLTPQNIVIGGINGAIPPLLGWTSIHNNIAAAPLLLVLLIFLWTPPHFWALAIAKQQDYKMSNIPMLPVTHGIEFTKLYILLYSIMLAAASALPFLIGSSGVFYLFFVMLLNARFIYLCLRLYLEQDSNWAMPTFWFSISYLMLLFILLIVDNFLPYG